MMGKDKSGRVRAGFFIPILLFCAGFLVAAIGLSGPAAEEKIDQSRLPRILAEVASYCRRFVDALIQNKHDVKEQRILMEENGVKKGGIR